MERYRLTIRSRLTRAARPSPARCALLLLTCLAACSRPSPYSGLTDYDPEAEQGLPGSAHEAISRVLAWSFGSRRAPPPTGPARIILRAAGQSLDQARQVSLCVKDAKRFNSMLVTPDGETVLMTINGILHTLPGASENVRPVAATFTEHMSVDALVAFKRNARPPVALAVVADNRLKERRAGNRGKARRALWTLRVDGGQVVGQPLASFRDMTSMARFFQGYESPRCRGTGVDCLVVDSPTDITRESKRDVRPRERVQELSGVHDIIQRQNGDQWLIQACQP